MAGRPRREQVPVLLFTGPVGVGKSTVLGAASTLLREARVRHAAVDLPDIACYSPAPADDEWNERLTHANLAALWTNFRDAGAERLLLARVLEARSLLGRIEAAVPGAEITVVLLRAPLAVLHQRIRARNVADPTWFLGAATYLDGVFESAGVADVVVDTAERPASEAAEEALRLTGWMS